MIRLLGSEWMRFWSRRLVRGLAALAIIGIVVSGVIGAVTSHRPGAAQEAAAERQYERWVKQCVRHHAFGTPVPEGVSVRDQCRSMSSVSSFEGTHQLLLDDMPAFIQGSGFLAILLGLTLGASFVGASWQTGTITTILTWEPRRVRWFLTRAVALFAGVLLLSLALIAILALVLGAAAALRGSSATSPGWLGDTWWTAVRVAMAAACASLIGAAVAMLARNTAAALGALFGYLLLFELLIQGLRPWYGRFLLIENLVAFTTWQPFARSDTYTITPGRGATTLAAYTVILMAAGAAMLRARDVN